jgi:hypothetical protein
MRVELTVEASEAVANKTYLIHDLSNKMSEYFWDKSYGEDVIEIFIGIICVAPEFEWFSVVRKPKYTTYRKYNRNGVEIIVDRNFCFDVKIDFNRFKDQFDNENCKMLASEILESLSILDKLPKKVKDFDKERFRADMKFLLKKQVLLETNQC